MQSDMVATKSLEADFAGNPLLKEFGEPRKSLKQSSHVIRSMFWQVTLFFGGEVVRVGNCKKKEPQRKSQAATPIAQNGG